LTQRGLYHTNLPLYLGPSGALAYPFSDRNPTG
jgi:hypothetical protein